MKGLLQELGQLNEIRELLDAVSRTPCRAMVTGLGGVHRAQTAAVLSTLGKRPLLVLCSEEAEMPRMAADLRALMDTEPVTLPMRELQLRPIEAHSRQWEYRRLAALRRMLSGKAQVVVTTAPALMQHCIPPDVLSGSVLTLATGQRHDLAELTSSLTAAGYTRSDAVEGPGQFALRGGILDIYSPDAEQAVRCEFFDDEIDAMGAFDVATQRRIYNVEQAQFLPCGEFLPFWRDGTAEALAQRMEAAAESGRRQKNAEKRKEALLRDAELLRRSITPPGSDRYGAAVYPEKATALDYLQADTLVCLSESGRISENVRLYELELRQDLSAAAADGSLFGELCDPAMTAEELKDRLSAFPAVQMESLPTSRYFLPPTALLQISAKQLTSYGGSLDTAVTDLTHYLSAGYRVAVLCGGKVRAENLHRLLLDRKIPAALDYAGEKIPQPGEVCISLGALSAGSEYPALRLAILTEGQLTSPLAGKKNRRSTPRTDARKRIQSYADLTVGDLVVHAHHGIGRFAGMVSMPVDGVEKDYIKISYAGGDSLYVPATSLDLVSKYIGGGENTEHTRLNRLGGTDWHRATRKAKAAAENLARGLIELYAQRQRQPGYAFSPDSPWQQEFEDAFEYEETADQLQAVREIKADMERPVPMDRLLCGDVGYGKTEVALRAVMKCIMDGKQAAILVPTTVLAQQHYATATNRFRSFPVTVEVLSRFRSPKQVKDITERVKKGEVDLLIGTHKLLQKDLQFKDLGLLIIDEEQRFGVKHKEKLRQKARQVDTLTLSATPIPRTMHMALSGIRDMSTITEPPRDRQSVQTYVLEHDWGVVAEAIRRELSRGGQVYYLRNRVERIESAALKIRELLGDDVSIGIAHGRMSEAELSRVMQQMSEGRIQVLVCTTIIETGIDIPNVNTLIIEDADRMGLAQLHQIRGRIGRSPRRAYAYLTYRPGKILTEVAAKRLSAIREYVDFGSGFKIAMRDLEIRGAGNLLGPEQSGYMMTVGYDMYLKLLNDAVLEQQGKAREIRPECSADLTVSAHIPESYVPAAQQRMDLYRRIAAIRTPEDADELLDELLDRYGELPGSVHALLEVALLRSQAADCGISEITQRGRDVLFTFTPRVCIPGLMAVCSMGTWRSRLLLHAGDTPRLTLRLKNGEDVLDTSQKLIEDMKLKRQELGADDEE